MGIHDDNASSTGIGRAITGPVSDADIATVQWLFDVNVYGVMRVTQAFAPLIIESKGRIINMGSISGNLAPEFLGPYAMSKHAIEAGLESKSPVEVAHTTLPP